jgi:hypothetical protein
MPELLMSCRPIVLTGIVSVLLLGVSSPAAGDGASSMADTPSSISTSVRGGDVGRRKPPLEADLPSGRGVPVRLSNTQLPLDTSGRPLRTGEAAVLQADGHWYFYFNDWGSCGNYTGLDTCSSPAGCASCAPHGLGNCVYDTAHVVRAYRTRDFRVWEDVGVVLPLAARTTGYLFRPHVVHNAASGRYVMWLEDHSTNASVHGMYHVATAATPAGPFAVVRRNVVMPMGPYPVMHVGDFDLFVDADGAAYHVRARVLGSSFPSTKTDQLLVHIPYSLGGHS